MGVSKANRKIGDFDGDGGDGASGASSTEFLLASENDNINNNAGSTIDAEPRMRRRAAKKPTPKPLASVYSSHSELYHPSVPWSESAVDESGSKTPTVSREKTKDKSQTPSRSKKLPRKRQNLNADMDEGKRKGDEIIEVCSGTYLPYFRTLSCGTFICDINFTFLYSDGETQLNAVSESSFCIPRTDAFPTPHSKRGGCQENQLRARVNGCVCVSN